MQSRFSDLMAALGCLVGRLRGVQSGDAQRLLLKSGPFVLYPFFFVIATSPLQGRGSRCAEISAPYHHHQQHTSAIVF
jgi:hypothetical protein